MFCFVSRETVEAGGGALFDGSTKSYCIKLEHYCSLFDRARLIKQFIRGRIEQCFYRKDQNKFSRKL